ncbi:D-alanyl-D-alanine carboxypeptidase family protein [Neobacillus bataviensis]|uniref:D-alanyl-D-alanine carboxypeptidase family protein n=1 Tax=Neobacillus bataviensis TaxID=220685 RepID=UPI001CBD671A|nr:D-alanyl-D-alanine carboxypeptidase family protein [Neobacillus bataviensis]
MKKLFTYFIIFLVALSWQMKAFAAEEPSLELKSEAACLLDSETGAVLYAKNADQKMYPASITKIATAIYAIEKGDLNSIATVSANAVRQDGTRVYLVAGEQVPLKKLIQGMLINSGNDAAVAIAEHLDGSVEHFAKNMNQYIYSTIGVKNTHFTNPNGLFDENHYTTAMDMAIITNYAMKNPIFREIFGTKELMWVGQSWSTKLVTHHRMLKGELPYPGITGGKTGFTTESRQTLSTTADNGKIKLTAVVMKSEYKNDKYKDTAALFDYGFSHFQNAILKQGEIYQKDQKQYYLDKDTVITEEINGASKEVAPNGILLIKNTKGQMVQEIPLHYKESKTVPKKTDLAAPSTKAQNAHNKQLTELNSIMGVIILGIAVLYIGMRRKSRKMINPK